MAWESLKNKGESYRAASAISPKIVVAINTATSRQVVAASGPAHEPVGVTIASAALAGQVSVFGRGNVVKLTAAASLGAGGNVGLAAATTSVAPVASGQWRVGKALESGAAGETVAVFVDPYQLVS